MTLYDASYKEKMRRGMADREVRFRWHNREVCSRELPFWLSPGDENPAE